jgi:hypothetical protein
VGVFELERGHAGVATGEGLHAGCAAGELEKLHRDHVVHPCRSVNTIRRIFSKEVSTYDFSNNINL